MNQVTPAADVRDNRHRTRRFLLSILVVLAGSLAVSGVFQPTVAQESTPSALPPLVAELQASWNAHDPDRYAALFTEDGVVELGFTDEVIASGRDQIANDFAAAAFAAYPDVRMDSRGWYASDDLLVWKWTFTGSYIGQEEGLPPGTGQPVSFAGISIYELRNGQIARKAFVTDDLAFMEQLGFTLELEQETLTVATPAA